MIGIKIVDTVIRLSITFPQNISETVTNETKTIGTDRGIPPKKYIPPVKRQHVFDDLRLLL